MLICGFRSLRLPLMLTVCSLAGCALHAGQSNSQVISAKDPYRDTEVARKLTAHAVQLIDQNQWTEAKKVLLQAVDTDVTFGIAHNNLGTVYLHENNLYEAAWEFQYAAKLMPYRPEPKSNLGLALESAGKLDDAKTYYDEALKLEPDNPDYLGNDARVRVRLGQKDTTVRALLTQLAAIDTRPQWVQWARERLAILGQPTTQPETMP